MTVDELTQKMLDRIDRPAMRVYANAFGTGTWGKFFNIDAFAHQSAEKAIDILKLDRGARCLLDVGCAFGYLCLAAECLGNQAIGFDVPARPVSAAWSGMRLRNVIQHRLKPHEKIKNERLRGPFHLVTMIGVNLVDEQKEWWNSAEYRFLVDDLFGRLYSGGMLYIEFNRGPENEFLKQIDWGHRFEREDNVIRIFA